MLPQGGGQSGGRAGQDGHSVAAGKRNFAPTSSRSSSRSRSSASARLWKRSRKARTEGRSIGAGSRLAAQRRRACRKTRHPPHFSSTGDATRATTPAAASPVALGIVVAGIGTAKTHASASPAVAPGAAAGVPWSWVSGPLDKLRVQGSRMLGTAQAVDSLNHEILKVLAYQKEAGLPPCIEDYDVSCNNLDCNLFRELLDALARHKARVERLKVFRCPLLGDEGCALLAGWLQSLPPGMGPLELHMSHCSVTTQGFCTLMHTIEVGCAVPCLLPYMREPKPLYLRLEHNNIDTRAILAKVVAGVIRPLNKQQMKVPALGPCRAKVALLVHELQSLEHENFLQEDPWQPQTVGSNVVCRLSSTQFHAEVPRGARGRRRRSSVALGAAAWDAPRSQALYAALPGTPRRRGPPSQCRRLGRSGAESLETAELLETSEAPSEAGGPCSASPSVPRAPRGASRAAVAPAAAAARRAPRPQPPRLGDAAKRMLKHAMLHASLFSKLRPGTTAIAEQEEEEDVNDDVTAEESVAETDPYMVFDASAVVELL